MDKIDRFDIEILYYLYENELKSKLSSSKVKDIMINSESKSTYYTYINRLKKLIENKMVDEGYKSGNAKCYYITELGSKYLENNILNDNTIIEEE